MRRYSDKQALSTLSEINVTPLLDLAFVLLIIFMITTPLLENSMDLIVPTSEAAEGAVDPAKVVTVSIDKNDVLKLRRKKFPSPSWRRNLRPCVPPTRKPRWWCVRTAICRCSGSFR
jgi:biopolymer transport protein ExbD